MTISPVQTSSVKNPNMDKAFFLMIAIIITLCYCNEMTASIVTDGSFESPNLGVDSYRYNPIGGAWSFSDWSGIIKTGAEWNHGQLSADDEQQFAFLQRFRGASSTINQMASLPTSGTYQLSFYEAGRFGNNMPPDVNEWGDLTYQVTLGTISLATFSTASYQNWEKRSVSFNAEAGDYLLSFNSLRGMHIDDTAFFDAVTITSTVPEPFSCLNYISAFGTLGFFGWRIHKQSR